MKNGFYISAYCAIDEEGCALNAQIRHDQSIALWRLTNNRVDLVKYWELERITRQKQHMRPFLNLEHFEIFLKELLSEVNVSIDQINEIWGMPEYQQLDWSNMLSYYKLPIHSLFHIFSSLINTEKQFTNFNLVLALDGGPDNVLDDGFDLPNHYAAAIFDKGNLVSIEPISSPAYFWAEASDRFRMREGTLMALAEACSCEMKICADHPIYGVTRFNSMWDIQKYRGAFDELWKEIVDAPLEMDIRFNENENRVSAFMKILQEISKRMISNEVLRLVNKYKLPVYNTILSIVGGFALNCPTNTWLMEQFNFADFVAPPCVNDAGISLGIGLMSFYSRLKDKLCFALDSPYYGSTDRWERFPIIYNQYISSISEFDIDTFIEDISQYPVCWFEGESEIGPRALGHRSILSSATTIEMKNLLNQIKQREWWRPVAPIILSDVLKEWCDPSIESPYMLHAVKIKEEKLDFVPAVLHLNNSARIQSVKAPSMMHSILNKYYQKTGIPIICNTSLNDKGEPIINNYNELMNFALRKKFPVIYVECHRVEIKGYELYPENTVHKSDNVFDKYLYNHYEYLERKYGNVKLDDETLDFYVNHRSYFPNLSIDSPGLKEKVDEVRMMISENLSSRNC